MAIQRALISVSNKDGIVSFARSLIKLGVEILSTGGTAKLLSEHGLKTIEVADYTNFPEIMAGRVKTLNPKIHGGILARRGIDEKIMQENNILAIDLVVVNLYPFAQTIAKKECTLETAIENIDIGGPAMLRSAAKNHTSVSVVVDSNDYAKIIQQINKQGDTNLQTRKKLAFKAFKHTANYDSLIAGYLGQKDDGFAHTLNLQFIKKQTTSYGENSHQNGALYIENSQINCVANATKIQGKEMSFNNYNDSDAALECVREFKEPTCVIVKHANPCGVASQDNIFNAYDKAYKTDPTSAFGGIIAFNRPLDIKTTSEILRRQFVEVIIAPSTEDGVQKILQKKPNIRVLIVGKLSNFDNGLDYKRVIGGLLVQDRDVITISDKLEVVSKIEPTKQQMLDLIFAFSVAKRVKSNAIVYVKNRQTVGIGAGQMSRIYSAKIAGIKAKDENLAVKGAVMASDAFFPFRDGIDAAIEVGIKAIIQPGGSIRDNEIIAAADEAKIAMVFTGMRHFKH